RLPATVHRPARAARRRPPGTQLRRCGGASPSPPSSTTCPLGIAGLRLAAGLAVLGRFTFFLSSCFFLAPTGLPEAFTFFGPLKLPASSLIARRSNCGRR